MTLFEVLVAGACWLYPLCMLFNYWRDWLCLRSLPTQPAAKRWIPTSRHGLLWGEVSPSLPPVFFLQRNRCTGMHFRSYGLLRWWEICLSIVISLVQLKGLRCLPLSLSAQPSLCDMSSVSFRRDCGQAEISSVFPRGRLVGKEMEIWCVFWSCLVSPSSRNWWGKGVSGCCILDICSCCWTQPWCGPAAGGGRLLLLPKWASGSMGITPWQALRSR